MDDRHENESIDLNGPEVDLKDTDETELLAGSVYGSELGDVLNLHPEDEFPDDESFIGETENRPPSTRPYRPSSAQTPEIDKRRPNFPAGNFRKKVKYIFLFETYSRISNNRGYGINVKDFLGIT